MPLSHKEAVERKKKAIEEIKRNLTEAKIAIFTDYRGDSKGMTVQSMTELRKRLRPTKSEFRVYKNTLCRIAVRDLGKDELADLFMNPTAILFGFEDPAATSKVLVEFLKEQKDNPLPKVKAGYMDGQVIDEAQIKVLATLPSRDELLAQLLRTMNAPLQGFVNVLAGVPRGLVTVLTRIKEQKEQNQN